MKFKGRKMKKIALSLAEAIIAVGVASTSAHGQKTTRTVTATWTFPFTLPAIIARSKATGTRILAHLSGNGGGGF